jgi:hypothetical protein
MSVANPETLKEWMEYVSILEPGEIVSKAKAANSKRFFDKMLEEGFTAQDITQIMQAFARRFLDFDLRPPGGLVDLVNLSKTDAVQGMKLPEGVEYDPEPDEIDRDIDELDLETEWEDTTPLPV